jgi:hypothetical protein
MQYIAPTSACTGGMKGWLVPTIWRITLVKDFPPPQAAVRIARGKRRPDLRVAGSSLVVCLHLLRNGESANDQPTTARLH